MSDSLSLADLEPKQQEAVLELLIVGMYIDGHLASAENAVVQSVADALGHESDYDRHHFIDELFTRASRTAHSEEGPRRRANELLDRFTDPALRAQALSLIEELLKADGDLSDREHDYLTMIRSAPAGPGSESSGP